MLRKAFLSYLTASMITIIVIMIELGFRSAVVSPFVLLDSNKESNPKVFVAHSLYQGDVLLTYQDGSFNGPSEASLQLSGKNINLTQIPSANGISMIETDKIMNDKALVFSKKRFCTYP